MSYNLILIIFILSSFLFGTSYADSFRLGLSYGQSKGLWVGEEEIDFDDKRVNRNISLSNTFNLSKGTKVVIDAAFSSVQIKGEPPAGLSVNADDSRSGISELGVKYLKSRALNRSFGYTYGAGFRAAGDNKGGNSFIALNDGQSKIDIYASLWTKLANKFSLSFNNRFTYRPNDGFSDQLLSEISLGVPLKKLYLGLSFAYFQTFGGVDIGGAGFMVNGLPGFSIVKEEYSAFNLVAAYKICKKYTADFALSSKLDGRNTDVNRSVMGGLTYKY